MTPAHSQFTTRLLTLGAMLLATAAASAAESPTWNLRPISGGDGEFLTEALLGREVRSARPRASGKFASYQYYQLPDDAPRQTGVAIIEVSFVDTGRGTINLQYNSAGVPAFVPYREAEERRSTGFSNRGGFKTAVFRLARPDFCRAQNQNADLRLTFSDPQTQVRIASVVLSWGPTPLSERLFARPWLEPWTGPTRQDVDATTLHHKVLCGYQGWFRCPGDPEDRGWVHWSRDSQSLDARTVTVDLWPDLSEFGDDETYPTPGFTIDNNRPARLFSSVDPRTIDRHFDWMQTYGLDGVFVQRFVVETGGPDSVRVLGYSRRAANRTGRVFAVEYDLSGTPKEQLFDRVTADWKWLIDNLQITSDPRYLHHAGLPVLGLWGFYPDRFDGATAHRLIDFFQSPGPYQARLVGGCDHRWRTLGDADWARAFRRLDVISPWNVGNTRKTAAGTLANTRSWSDDLAEARRHNRGFMPVIYPGFSWDHLQRQPAGTTQIDRLGGEFFWRQFQDAAQLEVEFVKIAMFDEVDEGTAIFKVTNQPPRETHFVTFPGQPSDWYLRLAAEGTRLIRLERANVPFRELPR
ncbi:MAG: hypothetical protein JSS02_22115 [Planctomycetes bacterium]|nr:hypothetical protein [Planctomycetota bacterium]